MNYNCHSKIEQHITDGFLGRIICLWCINNLQTFIDFVSLIYLAFLMYFCASVNCVNADSHY